MCGVMKCTVTQCTPMGWMRKSFFYSGRFIESSRRLSRNVRTWDFGALGLKKKCFTLSYIFWNNMYIKKKEEKKINPFFFVLKRNIRVISYNERLFFFCSSKFGPIFRTICPPKYVTRLMYTTKTYIKRLEGGERTTTWNKCALGYRIY